MAAVIAFVLLVGFAVETTRKVQLARPIFSEMRQTDSIKWLVWLYPLPFVLPYVHGPLLTVLFFPVPLSLLFFAPAILVAYRNQRSFERSGDDRVKRAESILHSVTTAGFLAIMCSLAITIRYWIKR
jgi:hypothetical protein